MAHAISSQTPASSISSSQAPRTPISGSGGVTKLTPASASPERPICSPPTQTLTLRLSHHIPPVGPRPHPPPSYNSTAPHISPSAQLLTMVRYEPSTTVALLRTHPTSAICSRYPAPLPKQSSCREKEGAHEYQVWMCGHDADPQRSQ